MTNLSSLQPPLGWGTPNVNHRNTPSPRAASTLINCVTSKTERDGVYYWDPVEFLVEGCKFKVPRYQFIIGSSHFTEKFGLLKTAGVHYSGLPVILEGVSAAQFRVFLKFLFPIHTLSTTSYFTKDEWLTISSLSTLWHFHSARELAKEHLEAHLDDPFEQIIFGRAAYVPTWVSSGYTQLVSRLGCISEEESEWIGHRTTVRLYVLRHELFDGRIVRDDLPLEIASRFSDEFGSLEKLEREYTGEKKHDGTSEDMGRRNKQESGDGESGERGKREEEEWRRLREEQRRRAIEEENRRKEEEEERRLERERKEEMEKRREEIEKRRKVEEEEQRKLREEEMRRAKEEERRRREEEERIRLERERLEEERKRKLEFEKKRRVEEGEGRKLREEGRRRAQEEEKKRLEEEERRRLERERLEKEKRKRLEFENRRKPEEEEARKLREEGRRRAEEEERRAEGETKRTRETKTSVNDDVRRLDRDRTPKLGEGNGQSLQENRKKESEWEGDNTQRMDSRRSWARGLMETYFMWRGEEGE